MLALMAAAAWTAATGGQAYGNSLLARELKLHRELSYASIDLDAPAGGHFEAGIRSPGMPETALAVAELDRPGRTIGALSTSFMIGPDGRSGAYRSALRVQRDVSRSVQGIEKRAHWPPNS